MKMETQREKGSFRVEDPRQSSSPGRLFGSERSQRRTPGEVLPGRAPSPGAQRAVTCAGLRREQGSYFQDTKGGAEAPHSLALGALRSGGGEIRERAGGQKQHLSDILFPPTSPTSRSARQGLSPTAPHPIPPPGLRLGPVDSHRRGCRRRAARKRRALRLGPKIRTLTPWLRQPKAFTHATNRPVTGLRVCAGRSSPILLLFLIKSPLGCSPELIGREPKGNRGERGKKRGVSSNQLCNPALPRAIRRHA